MPAKSTNFRYRKYLGYISIQDRLYPTTKPWVPSWCNYFFEIATDRIIWEYEPAKAQHPFTGLFPSFQQHKSHREHSSRGSQLSGLELVQKTAYLGEEKVGFFSWDTTHLSVYRASQTAEIYALEINEGWVKITKIMLRIYKCYCSI